MHDGEGILGRYINPSKIFSTPTLFSDGTKKVKVGEYAPIIDAVTILTKISDSLEGDMLQYLSKTLNEFGRIVLSHEVVGHGLLTRKSSFWYMLFMSNFYYPILNFIKRQFLYKDLKYTISLHITVLCFKIIFFN